MNMLAIETFNTCESICSLLDNSMRRQAAMQATLGGLMRIRVMDNPHNR
jgi:hypothetical protein